MSVPARVIPGPGRDPGLRRTVGAEPLRPLGNGWVVRPGAAADERPGRDGQRAAVQAELACSPLPLYLLPPPYTRFELVGSIAALRPEETTPGTLLALGVSRPEEDWPILQDLVPRLSARYPALPIVLRVQHPPCPGSLDFARRMGTLRIRAVLSEDDPVPEILRDAMTSPPDLGDDVVDWLSIRGLRLTPHVAGVLREIFRRAAQRTDLDGLLRSIGAPPSTVRKWFRMNGLPSPGQWHDVARALWAALRLQREPGTPLLATALALGYADHSALSRRMVQLFGLRPGVIRELLGWELLLDRWLTRKESLP